MRDPIRPASLAVLLNRREPLLEALYIVERSPTILRKGIGIREGRNLEPSTKRCPRTHQDRYDDSSNKGAQDTSSSSPSTFSFD